MTAKEANFLLSYKKKEKESLEKKINASQDKIDEQEKSIADLNSELLFIGYCIDKQVENKKFIEKIVNFFLSGVYGDSYEFRYDVIREEKEIVGLKQVLKKDNQLVEVESSGGGVQNIISFGHSYSFLKLNPHLDQVLFFDESLNNLSKSRWIKFIEKLVELNQTFPTQVGFITHNIDDNIESIDTFQVKQGGKFNSTIQRV